MSRKFILSFFSSVFYLLFLCYSKLALATSDSQSLNVQVHIEPMIQIANMQDEVSINTSNGMANGDRVAAVNFTVTRQGAGAESNTPYSIQVASQNQPAGKAGFYSLSHSEDSMHRLSMKIAFTDEQGRSSMLPPGQAQGPFYSSAAPGEPRTNAHLNLSIPAEDIRDASPGRYSTSLVVMVQAL